MVVIAAIEVKSPPAYTVDPDTANALTGPLTSGFHEVLVPVESNAHRKRQEKGFP